MQFVEVGLAIVAIWFVWSLIAGNRDVDDNKGPSGAGTIDSWDSGSDR